VQLAPKKEKRHRRLSSNHINIIRAMLITAITILCRGPSLMTPNCSKLSMTPGRGDLKTVLFTLDLKVSISVEQPKEVERYQEKIQEQTSIEIEDLLDVI
jgi:hypothetical protein